MSGRRRGIRRRRRREGKRRRRRKNGETVGRGREGVGGEGETRARPPDASLDNSRREIWP